MEREFRQAVDAHLRPPADALWAERVRGWGALPLPARRCYLECVLHDVIEDGPLSREEVERLDGGCRDYYLRLMLTWARASGTAAVRALKQEVRQVVLDELEGRAAPKKVILSWRNRYGGDG